MLKAVKRLQSKRPPAVSFLYGPEPYFRYKIIKDVRQHYTVRGYDIETLDGSKIKDRALADALDTTSLFSGSDKIIIVQNAEKIKGKVPQMLKYMKSPSDAVMAIFDYAQQPPKGKKEAALTPLGKLLKEHAYTYESKQLNSYKREQSKWLIEAAAAQGKTLPDGFARAIYMSTGDSVFALSNALRKVVLYSESSIIEKSDIQAVLTNTATNQSYELTNAYGERNIRKTLKILDAFYHQAASEPAVWITKTLLNYIEKLIRAKSLLGYGLDPRDAAKVLNMSPWAFENQLKPQIARFKLSELLTMYDNICGVDIIVKGSGLSGRAVLESFLVRSLT